ncbi:hypothetical protein Pcinc_032616 [Petrolisthes cinctipes]|uniref:Rab-GAP TBC domain-containing protein n=1 Tax=Petrolisthes cinctipes TaxID=88211 RepID=A0AAE1EUE2_PETCI|nr:hypothetical protein Pcinc_032616 [Petrolisthes cinctipes]
MPLNGILRRASSFLGITASDTSKPIYEDGDVVFCKNNVCVHPPSRYRGDGEKVHHPGYLVIKCQKDPTHGTTLHLNWIPNERLRRNHDLVYHLNTDGNSRSNSPFPASDSESLSVSSLVLNDSCGTVRKSSLDDAALSTSGISTLDTASEATHSKGEVSPNSDTTDTNQRVDADQPCDDRRDSGNEEFPDNKVVDIEASVEANEFQEKLETHGEERETESRVVDEKNSEENITFQKNNKILDNESEGHSQELERTFGERTVKKHFVDDSDEDIQQEDNLTPVASAVSDFHEEFIKAEQVIQSKKGEYVEDLKTECVIVSKKDQSLEERKKEHYVSSSSSSCDEDKVGDTQTITETPESCVGRGHLTSDGEESLESSPEPQSSSLPHYLAPNNNDQLWYEGSAESMAFSANLAFPESSLSSFCPTPVDGGSSPIRRMHKCGIFSIDLSHTKSLRLFFSDRDHTCGQLVIASQESQYKIFHFHHGGLDKLAAVFEDWNILVKPGDEEGVEGDASLILKKFLVCKPEVSKSELHPEEGQHACLDAESWVTYFSEEGQIEDDLALRRAIFFGGVEPQLRANVWPFLLHYYDFRTSFTERQAIMEEKHALYQKINTMRENMDGQELDWFKRNVQCTVEKDVVRTDRSNPCFAGNDNPNLEKMKRILLNFAVHNKVMGYTQGMSDILAPILAEVRNEADVFWCFSGLMSKTIFVTSPKDEDMEKNLSYLRELLRIMTPRFFNHMAAQQDGLDLLFCHRWILLCFKREFPEDEALAMWEACWSNYQTDYFHLFLVVAIVSIYGNDVVDQNLRPDETLLYFTSLANHMDGHITLKKARGLLHQYRSMSRLPCTLVGLCELCGPGMWDSGHAPTVECEGHQDNQSCPLTQHFTEPPTTNPS